jgi:hypothetical protein
MRYAPGQSTGAERGPVTKRSEKLKFGGTNTNASVGRGLAPAAGNCLQFPDFPKENIRLLPAAM